MRLNIIIAACIGLLTYGLTLYMDGRSPGVTQAPINATTPQSGDTAPDFTFTDINNKTHSLRDFEGKTVILNFWASWCPPCIKEFPLLLKAAEQNKDSVILIALSSDHDPEAMTRFTDKLALENADNVFIALDEETKITGGLFQTFRLPETIIIDPEQKLQHKLVGANWGYEELIALLKP